MFKIGNLKIENNVCLAPMAGVCNSAFRRIVKEYGEGLRLTGRGQEAVLRRRNGK